MAARFGRTQHRTSNASPGEPAPETFSRTRPHAVVNLRGFVAIPLEIRFSTILQGSYVLSMFMLMVDDTQVPRDASDGLGGADDTARPDEAAADDGRAPVPEEAGAP